MLDSCFPFSFCGSDLDSSTMNGDICILCGFSFVGWASLDMPTKMHQEESLLCDSKYSQIYKINHHAGYLTAELKRTVHCPIITFIVSWKGTFCVIDTPFPFCLLSLIPNSRVHYYNAEENGRDSRTALPLLF